MRSDAAKSPISHVATARGNLRVPPAQRASSSELEGDQDAGRTHPVEGGVSRGYRAKLEAGRRCPTERTRDSKEPRSSLICEPILSGPAALESLQEGRAQTTANGQRQRQKNFCISHKQNVRCSHGSDGHEEEASPTREQAAYVRSSCFALRLRCHVTQAHPLYTTAAPHKRVLGP